MSCGWKQGLGWGEKLIEKGSVMSKKCDTKLFFSSYLHIFALLEVALTI